jgi:thiol-disulfide isomerase/thioredoxin
MRSFSRLVLVLICTSVGYVAAAQETTSGPVVPEAAKKLFAEGVGFENRQQLSSAADSYRAALKAADRKCLVCLEALAAVQLRMDEYKESAVTDAQIAAEATDARARAEAEMREGMAFFQLSLAETVGLGAIDKNPKHADISLHKAEAILKQAAADDPSDEAVRMAHARVLAALKQDDVARSEFAACAAMPGTSQAECARALRFSKDVDRARGEAAPAFEAKTMDGKTVSLDSLAGKVVLVDFWATWCGFCKRDSAYVQSMLDSFDKDHFVLLEVDVDEDVEAWKMYVKQERLQGVQVHDERHALQDVFHVGAFPTYVIFDGDGVVQLREVGAKGDLRGTVRRLLNAPPTATPAAAAGN